MSSYFTNYSATVMFQPLTKVGNYLALHAADPTTTGLIATEVAGGGYARQPINLSAPSSKTIVSRNAQVFSGMPAVTVKFLAIWDSVSGGHCQIVIDLVPLIGGWLTVPASGQVLLAAGDVAVTL